MAHACCFSGAVNRQRIGVGNSRRFFLKGSHVFKFFGLDIVARLLMNQGREPATNASTKDSFFLNDCTDY